MLTAVVVSLRPRQWVKNLFVFGGLIFGQRLFDPPAVGIAVAAFLVFCGLAGAIYLLNDVADRDKDRLHPDKRNRPVASGRLPTGVALVVAAAGVPVTLTLNANPNAAGAILRGTLTAVTDATGVASFNDLRIDQAGQDYVLRASSGALIADDSGIFTISSSTATQLAFLAQPLDAGQNVAITAPTGVTVQRRLRPAYGSVQSSPWRTSVG